MNHRVIALASMFVLLATGSAAATLPSPADQAPFAPPPPTGPGFVDPLRGLPGLSGSLLDGVLGFRRLRPGQTAHLGGLANPVGGLSKSAYAGYGTGTATITEAALREKNEKIDTELAFSGAVYSSERLGARGDELNRSVSPALAAGHGFGRGSALELGPDPTGNQPVIDDDAEAKAPPNGNLVTNEPTDLNLPPVIEADAFLARASARSASNGCVVGSDLAYGLGSAARSQFAKNEKNPPVLSLSEDTPPRAVTQSMSATRLVPPAKGSTGFGLVSETRQTIAPVKVFEGTDQELTVEVAGEWVLKVVADGTKGSVTYGPDTEAPPHTPVLTIATKGQKAVVFTLQDFLDKNGAAIEIPALADIGLVIGEDARAITGSTGSQPTVSGTLVAAAVDIVRLEVTNPLTGEPARMRIGHMEAAVTVPPGGIPCPGIGMAKESNPETVAPGEKFSWTITVGNPNDCILEKIKVVDTVTATPGLRYTVVGTTPKAAVANNTYTFEGIGSLRQGQTKTVRIDVQVDPDSPPGTFSDEAVSTGSCGTARVGGQYDVDTSVGAPPPPVDMDGRVSLEGPPVTYKTAAAGTPSPLRPGADAGALSERREAASPGAGVDVAGTSAGRSAEIRPRGQVRSGSGPLPRTGGADLLLAAAALLAVSGGLWRLRRRP